MDYRCPIQKLQRKNDIPEDIKLLKSQTLSMPSKKDVQDIINHITWVHERIKQQQNDEAQLKASLNLSKSSTDGNGIINFLHPSS